MDWASERYIRVYTRDTLTWKRLRFEGQTVFMHVARKLDRSGRLPLDGMGAPEAVSILTDVPTEIAEVGIARLFDLDVFILEGDALVAPNWAEAQEAKAGAAERQRRYRDRKKEGLASDGTDGHVYILSALATGHIKIGVSADVDRRVTGLQTSVPGGVKLLHTEPGGPVRERELHAQFQADRVNGEWFKHSDAIKCYLASSPTPLRNGDAVLRSGNVAETSRVTPSLAEPSLAEPSPPSAGDLLIDFAKAWGQLTGRSDFDEYIASGIVGGTKQQALVDFRKACGGSVAEFRARVSARLANDRNDYNLTQSLIRWSTDLINNPASAPTASKPTAPYHAPMAPQTDDGPGVACPDDLKPGRGRG